MERIARRLVAGACAVAFASPAFAHGEEIVAVSLLILWGVPAAAVALLPWDRPSVRVNVAVIPPIVGGAALAVLIRLALQRNGDEALVGAALIPVIVYGPPVCNLLLAAGFYLLRRRRAA